MEIRELFHVEFLRRLARTLESSCMVLKGGTNLRFFFKSIRYSEDMNIDVKGIPVHIIRDKVMNILNTHSFETSLKPYGIMEVIPPNISKAKQTETVQRFKIHIMTSSGENLFTKIEFSRRGFDQFFKAEGVSPVILNKYKLPPLIVPHYLIESVFKQKLSALMQRSIPQARDIFDLYMLSTQINIAEFKNKKNLNSNELINVIERVDQINYKIYKDTVVSYLDIEDQQTYNSSQIWDQIRLDVLNLVEKEFKKNA